MHDLTVIIAVGDYCLFEIVNQAFKQEFNRDKREREWTNLFEICSLAYMQANP